MSLGAPTARGAVFTAPSSAVQTLALASAVPAGSTAYALIGFGNVVDTATGTTVVVTDDTGATWAIDVIDNAQRDAVYIASRYCPNGLPIATVITATFSKGGANAKGIQAGSFSGHGIIGPTAHNSVPEASATNSTWSTGATAAISAVSNALSINLNRFGAESDKLGSVPASASWSNVSAIGLGGGAAFRAFLTYFSSAIASGSVTSAGHFAGSTKWAVAVATYREKPAQMMVMG